MSDPTTPAAEALLIEGPRHPNPCYARCVEGIPDNKPPDWSRCICGLRTSIAAIENEARATADAEIARLTAERDALRALAFGWVAYMHGYTSTNTDPSTPYPHRGDWMECPWHPCKQAADILARAALAIPAAPVATETATPDAVFSVAPQSAAPVAASVERMTFYQFHAQRCADCGSDYDSWLHVEGAEGCHDFQPAEPAPTAEVRVRERNPYCPVLYCGVMQPHRHPVGERLEVVELDEPDPTDLLVTPDTDR